MSDLVTQLDVARACGLPRSTVAHALNPKLSSKISAEVRQRVLDAVHELGYRPDRQAQLMRGLKSGVIGVIQAAGVTQFAIEFAYELAGAIHCTEYRMLGCDAAVYREGISAAVQVMLDARVEGVVLMSPPAWFPLAELEQLRAAKIPMVAMAGVPIEGVPRVAAGHQQGMSDLTQHMLGLGHRRLVMLTAAATGDGTNSDNVTQRTATWSIQKRINGFCEAIIAAGGEVISSGPTDQYVDPGQTASADDVIGEIYYADACDSWRDPYQVGYVAMQRFLQDRREQLPDAVLCSNDDWAMGALAACDEAGIRVPQDLAITGYDNAVYSRYGSTALTTVAQPLTAMAQRTVATLVGLIQGRQTMEQAAREVVRLPCEVVVRKSCGAKIGRS